MAALDLLTRDDLEPVLAELRAIRADLARIRAANAPELVPLPEAARRLGRTLRSIQRQAANGGLEVEMVGGVRMVRLPAGAPRG